MDCLENVGRAAGRAPGHRPTAAIPGVRTGRRLRPSSSTPSPARNWGRPFDDSDRRARSRRRRWRALAPSWTVIVASRYRLPKRSRELVGGSRSGLAARERVRRACRRQRSGRARPAAPRRDHRRDAGSGGERAAATLLSMPPRPSGLPLPSTPRRPRRRSRAAPLRVGGVRAVDAVHLGEEHEQPRAEQHGDLGGERVVVAEGDLVRRGRVVLVHDGDDAELSSARSALRTLR